MRTWNRQLELGVLGIRRSHRPESWLLDLRVTHLPVYYHTLSKCLTPVLTFYHSTYRNPIFLFYNFNNKYNEKDNVNKREKQSIGCYGLLIIIFLGPCINNLLRYIQSLSMGLKRNEHDLTLGILHF